MPSDKKNAVRRLIKSGLPVLGRILERTPAGAVAKEVGVLDAVGDILGIPKGHRNDRNIYDGITHATPEQILEMRRIEADLEKFQMDMLQEQHRLDMTHGHRITQIARPVNVTITTSAVVLYAFTTLILAATLKDEQIINYAWTGFKYLVGLAATWATVYTGSRGAEKITDMINRR